MAAMEAAQKALEEKEAQKVGFKKSTCLHPFRRSRKSMSFLQGITQPLRRYLPPPPIEESSYPRLSLTVSVTNTSILNWRTEGRNLVAARIGCVSRRGKPQKSSQKLDMNVQSKRNGPQGSPLRLHRLENRSRITLWIKKTNVLNFPDGFYTKRMAVGPSGASWYGGRDCGAMMLFKIPGLRKMLGVY